MTDDDAPRESESVLIQDLHELLEDIRDAEDAAVEHEAWGMATAYRQSASRIDKILENHD